MEEVKLISKSEALALSNSVLEEMRGQEAEAMAYLNVRITEAAKEWRRDVSIRGYQLSLGHSGPIMFPNKTLLLNEHLHKILEDDGYRVWFPHVSNKEDSPEVTVVISWG